MAGSAFRLFDRAPTSSEEVAAEVRGLRGDGGRGVTGKKNRDPWMIRHPRYSLAIISAAVVLAWLVLGYCVPIDLRGSSDTSAGALGDQFGAVNALFSGLAFGFLIFELALQRRELADQRESRDDQTRHITLQTKQLNRAQEIQLRMMEADAISQAVRFPARKLECNRIRTSAEGVVSDHLSIRLPLDNGTTSLVTCYVNRSVDPIDEISILPPRADAEMGGRVFQEIWISGNPNFAELWFLARAPNGLEVYYRFDLDPHAQLGCILGPCGWAQVPEGVRIQITESKSAAEDSSNVD